MQEANAPGVIEEAIALITEMNPQITDGAWLEDLTVQAGPHIKEWDIAHAYHWGDWPEREQRCAWRHGVESLWEVVTRRKYGSATRPVAGQSWRPLHRPSSDNCQE